MTRITTLQTAVELPEFQRHAKAIMSDDERMSLIGYIAANPEAGVSLGGGLCKVRIPREGGGKSDGCRPIYVFGGRHMPIYLVTVLAKNEKDNLTRAEQAAAVELSKALITSYERSMMTGTKPLQVQDATPSRRSWCQTLRVP
jgi:hypothetical protein